MLLKEVERAQHLFGESSDEFERKPAEGIGFDEFVEIHVKKLGRNAEMAAEIETVSEVDHTMPILRILKVD